MTDDVYLVLDAAEPRVIAYLNPVLRAWQPMVGVGEAGLKRLLPVIGGLRGPYRVLKLSQAQDVTETIKWLETAPGPEPVLVRAARLP